MLSGGMMQSSRGQHLDIQASRTFAKYACISEGFSCVLPSHGDLLDCVVGLLMVMGKCSFVLRELAGTCLLSLARLWVSRLVA